MKLSLCSSRRLVDAAQPTSAGAVLLSAMAHVGSSAHSIIALPTEQMLDLPKIQGSIFLADFSHLLRGHG